jgi:hypothetical protein
MVTTLWPCTADTGVTQERVACPSICTVQAPQSAMPQPNFVPVSPTASRMAQSNGISGATSSVVALPLRVKVTDIDVSEIFKGRASPALACGGNGAVIVAAQKAI